MSNKRETNENLNKLRLLATTQSLSISPTKDFLMASESYMSMGQKSRGRVGVKENFRERRGHPTFENLFSDL